MKFRQDLPRRPSYLVAIIIQIICALGRVGEELGEFLALLGVEGEVAEVLEEGAAGDGGEGEVAGEERSEGCVRGEVRGH